jgi:hypothetical protein
MAFGMKVTDAGAVKITAATVSGIPIVVTEIAWGDASGVAYDPTGEETELVNERLRNDIVSMEIDATQTNVIKVKGLIQSAPTSFTLLEIGLYDEDGDLIAIGNHPAQQIPAAADDWALNYEPTFLVAISNVGSITVNISPSTDYLTKEEADSFYKALGDGVQSVTAGWAITVNNSDPHNPIVIANQATLDARYRRLSVPIDVGAHTHPNATQSVAGFMSAPDKIKLDGLGGDGGGGGGDPYALFQRIFSASGQKTELTLPYMTAADSIPAIYLVHGYGITRSNGKAGKWRLRTGAGAVDYTSNNYNDYPSGNAVSFPLEAYTEGNSDFNWQVDAGHSGLIAGEVIRFYLVNLNQNAPTYIFAPKAAEPGSFLDMVMFPEKFLAAAAGAKQIHTVNRVENRITLWVGNATTVQETIFGGYWNVYRCGYSFSG